MRRFETTKTKVKHAYLKFAAASASAATLVFIKDIDGLRNIAPEPFDFFDHVGNCNVSVQLGYFAGYVVGRAFEDKPLKPAGLRTRMALGGAAVGLAINGMVETKFGIGISEWHNTIDPIDYLYGVAAAAGGAILPNIVQEKQTQYVLRPELADDTHDDPEINDFR